MAALKINPRRITAALDARGLFGPEVDAALGVEEPTVDMWEAGTLEPTSAQVARLAMLTGFSVGWFFRADSLPAFTSGWICGRGRGGCQPLGDDETATQESLW